MEVNEPIENYKTGYISIYRSIKKHWIWDDPIKFQWWMDILLTVNYSDRKVNLGYEVFDCKRGESLNSLQTWAKQFNCHKSKVRRFFELLEKDNMIVTKSVHKTTHLTVLKYDSYQIQRNDDETEVKHRRNGSETEVTPNNKDNNINKDNKLKERANNFGETLTQFITIENKKDIIAFWNYWTEPNKSKTQLKFEMEKTWDTKRRIDTWLKRSNTFKK